jgi:hypothetical protein
MQYWRADLQRMSTLAGNASPACLRGVFGAAYQPVRRADLNGADGFGGDLPEPPVEYAEVIRRRYAEFRRTGCGSCTDPLASER